MKPVFTFTRKVKGQLIQAGQISDSQDISRINNVLAKLEHLSGVRAVRINEIEIRTNPRKWVESLLAGYPNNVQQDHIESLLADFTDSMRSRMREESKYVLGILLEDRLLLCHSIYGEETITPEWKIIPRMLDIDNILRYVYFVKKDNDILVKYWEREATVSFIEWLGLSRKQAFLFGGKYRIRSEIEDVTVELQLAEEEIENWLATHPEVRKGRIDLRNPIHYLTITGIRAGSKYYDNPEDFFQDFEAEKYGAPLYQKEYDRLQKGALPLLVKHYDEETRVIRIEGDEEFVEVEKRTPGFEVIFANGTIEMRASYVARLCRKFVNGEDLFIFHAGQKFSAAPVVIRRMRIYNNLSVSELSRRIIDFYNDVCIQDRDLDILLKYLALATLREDNSRSPIAYLFNSLMQELAKSFSAQRRLTRIEDQMLEYKSRDFFSGDNEQIVQRFTSDISTKLKSVNCKIYVVGVEDNGVIDPIPVSRLRSDRVEYIRMRLEENLSLKKLYAFPVTWNQEGLLVMVALRA